MGFIRKSLAVGTLGTVSGSSKKQRVARAQLSATRQATAVQQQILAELTGSVAAKRAALLAELAALPGHHSSLTRIRQIKSELAALPR